jgi:hypothetical protein
MAAATVRLRVSGSNFGDEVLDEDRRKVGKMINQFLIGKARDALMRSTIISDRNWSKNTPFIRIYDTAACFRTDISKRNMLMLLVGSPAASTLHDEVPAFSGFAKKIYYYRACHLSS